MRTPQDFEHIGISLQMRGSIPRHMYMYNDSYLVYYMYTTARVHVQYLLSSVLHVYHGTCTCTMPLI